MFRVTDSDSIEDHSPKESDISQQAFTNSEQNCHLSKNVLDDQHSELQATLSNDESLSVNQNTSLTLDVLECQDSMTLLHSMSKSGSYDYNNRIVHRNHS